MKPYEIIKRERIYDGKIINLVKDTILLPNGKETKRELVEHNGAAVIIAEYENKLIFTRQHRHSAGDFTLELPAGKLEKGEDPKECALRELKEETGMTADNMAFLFKAYSSIGFSNEILYFYIAKGLTEGEQNPDEDEFIDIEKYSIEETVEMIFNGKIIDSKTVSGVLAYKELCGRKDL